MRVRESGPDMQIVADRTAHQCHQIGRAATGGKATDEQPILATDGHVLH